MTKKTKDFLNLIGSIIFSGLFIIATIAIIKVNVNVDLAKANQITGQVTSAKIISHTPSGGQIRVKGNVFFIKLDNSEELFATYRPNQDYSALTKEINIGDTITIYYRPKYSNGINLDVYQITKNDIVLQDYSSYNKNHKIVAWTTGFASLVTLTIGIYPYYKNAQRRKMQIQKNSS